MSGEWYTGKELEWSERELMMVTFWHLPGMTKETITNVRNVGTQAKTWTRYLMKTSLEY
jgi:hypothetical protein